MKKALSIQRKEAFPIECSIFFARLPSGVLSFRRPKPQSTRDVRMICSILVTTRNHLLLVVFYGLVLLAAGCGGNDSDPGPIDAACADVGSVINDLASDPRNVVYGFYTDFEPMSYADTQDRSDPGFHRPLGYEPSLIEAVDELSGDWLQFRPIGIGGEFSGIWLLSAADPHNPFDMVGGGITVLPDRRYAQGDREREKPLITFGDAHVKIFQSLLVRSESSINSHDDLGSSHTVGLLKGTTGESRLLQLTEIADAQGYLRSGTIITLEDGSTLTTEQQSHRITASESTTTPGIETRKRLVAPGDDIPEIQYFSSENEQIEAVTDGVVDAVARGEVGNQHATDNSNGELRVTAVDRDNSEDIAFSYPHTPEGDSLRGIMDNLINCLTDGGSIGFAQWHENPRIFLERAERNAP